MHIHRYTNYFILPIDGLSITVGKLSISAATRDSASAFVNAYVLGMPLRILKMDQNLKNVYVVHILDKE